MPICKACGSNIATGKKFCTECGAPMTVETGAPEPVSAPPPRPSEPVFAPVQEPATTEQSPRQPEPVVAGDPPLGTSRPGRSQRGEHSSFAFSDPDAEPPSYSEYAVVSTGDFLGVMLLMLIPVANIILLIVWACGGCKKVNKRNYARAALVMVLISAVIGVIVSLFVGSTAKGLINQATSFF